MSRYIDADIFKYNIERASEKMHLIRGVKAVDIGAVITALDMMPTADVVEVVRCTDCKHCKCIRYTSVGQATWHCSKAYGLPDVDPMDYCSDGERREE